MTLRPPQNPRQSRPSGSIPIRPADKGPAVSPGGGSAPQVQIQNKIAIEEIFTDEQLVLFRRKNFSELHFDLQNSLRRFPNNVNAQYGLFICAMSINEAERAATYASKALELDETLKPGELINEIPTGDPEDWLTVAEEIGHSGYFEAAVDICDRIAASNQFESKIRALAAKTKEAVKQDFFTARERIATGNGPKQEKDVTGKIRFASVFTFVITPILIFMIAGCWFYSEFKYTEGQNNLRAGIYRYERIKNGDQSQDKNGPSERYFYKAADCFQKSRTFNPFNSNALFLQVRTYEVLLNLGNYRNRDIYNLDEHSWTDEQFKTVRSAKKECAEKFSAKQFDKKTLDKKKKAWGEFYKSSISDPGTAVL